MARGRRPNTSAKSGRGKRKTGGQGGLGKVEGGSRIKPDDLPSDPRVMYVNADPPISVPTLAKMYEGRRGCAPYYLVKRCTKEKWVKQRKEKQARVDARTLDEVVEKEGVTRAEQIERANLEHVKFGKKCREAAATLLEKATGTGADAMKSIEKAKDALRIVSQLGAKGVDIERKGLGLADKFVHVRVIRESTYKFIEVLRTHLSTQPDLLEVMISECTTILLKVEQDAAEKLNIDEFE